MIAEEATSRQRVESLYLLRDYYYHLQQNPFLMRFERYEDWRKQREDMEQRIDALLKGVFGEPEKRY